MIDLISITGRISSGKDLTAKIIRRLDMISAVEKNKISAQLFPTMESLIQGDPFISSHWKVRKFAGTLKQIASLLTGIPVEKFEDQEFKNTFLPKEWNYKIPYSADAGQDGDVSTEAMTVRKLLQKLGTEAIRDGLHHNAWVNALFNSIQPGEKTIITDTRFPNELARIEKAGGLTIRVHRKGTVKENEHISETALDHHQFHYEIYNDGTAEDLEKQIKAILIEQKII